MFPSDLNPPEPLTPETLEPNQIPPPSKPNFQYKKLFPLFLIIGFIPLTVAAVLSYQSFSSQAANRSLLCRQKINSVRVNPGLINTYLNSQPTRMSALAYDQDGHPIWKDVAFEWGMSSVNSIGDLKTNDQLAVFKPLNTGFGDVWATGSYCGQKARGSTRVTVSPALPTPTSKCLPQPKCLYTKPFCKISVPAAGWCPKTTSLPTR